MENLLDENGYDVKRLDMMTDELDTATYDILIRPQHLSHFMPALESSSSTAGKRIYRSGICLSVWTCLRYPDPWAFSCRKPT